MKIIFSLFILSISLFSFSQDDNQAGSKKQVTQLIENLKGLSPKEYTLKIEDVRDNLERYIENKKGVCKGDFSTVVLSRGEQESSNKKSVKLSKEEREVCFRELKQIQQTYIESLFEVKKRYLVYLHELRLNELEVAKEEAIKELMKTFNKKGRR